MKLEESKYPLLESFARKYLDATSFPVYSERFFFGAGILNDQKRNPLLPKTGEKLLFPYHNLKKKTRIVFIV